MGKNGNLEGNVAKILWKMDTHSNSMMAKLDDGTPFILFKIQFPSVIPPHNIPLKGAHPQGA
jgi:hypothetical protein